MTDHVAAPALEEPSGRAVAFGLTDVKPHRCRLPEGWHAILDGRARYWRADYDPGEFLDHPDRLPDDWRQPYPLGSRVPGDVLSCDRLYRDILHGLDLILDAFQTAGWGQEEAAHLLQHADIHGHATGLGADAWDYRRFGFSVTETTYWLSHVNDPAIARLYADMGYKPGQAKRLITWAKEHFAVWRRADAQAAVMCFRTPRRRARDYVLAGISHDEIHYWERHRQRLEPGERAEHDRTLALMAALNDQPDHQRSRQP